MKTQHRAGFSIVEVTIAIIVLLILGTLGYILNARLRADHAATDPATNSVQAESATIKQDLESMDIDESTDTTDIDTALQ